MRERSITNLISLYKLSYNQLKKKIKKRIKKKDLEKDDGTPPGVGTKPQIPTGRGVSAPKTNIP